MLASSISKKALDEQISSSVTLLVLELQPKSFFFKL